MRDSPRTPRNVLLRKLREKCKIEALFRLDQVSRKGVSVPGDGHGASMQKQATRKVIAVLDDLFFTVKIKDAAARAGLDVEFLKSEEAVLDRAKQNPTVIVVDLNTTAVQPLQLIQKLKATDELRQISVIGYVSHVQGELKQKAHETGCDMVLARSAFSQNLPQIFKRHAGLLAG